jgi:putative transposase
MVHLEGERPREPPKQEETAPEDDHLNNLEGERPREPYPNESVMNMDAYTQASPWPQRKRPAHQTPIEQPNRPVLLFVTLALQPRGDFLASADFHSVYIEACRDADAWHVGRYVIMPDHVHLFCSPAQWPPAAVRIWAQYLKRRITIRLAHAGHCTERHSEGQTPGGRASSRAAFAQTGVKVPWRWQSDCWDTQMRTGEQYRAKWLYVRDNPVRAKLVETAEQWPFQGELHAIQW